MAAEQAVGIDGFRGGWVAAIDDDGDLRWATAAEADVGTLIPEHGVTAVDMPIGLLEAGERECDSLARTHLPGATSRVFMTPPRVVLEQGLLAPNEEVQHVCRVLTGKGVSRQALGLASRILVLDEVLRRRPDTHVVEAHPEICFCAMAGSGPLASKKSAAGVGQRMAALRTWLPDLDDVVSRAPQNVPIDDALDALACLWTARRWAGGTGVTIPEGAAARPFIAV
jgi:predicted RNase H-like nuclease